MKKTKDTLDLSFERKIAAPQQEVFDAWLNPLVPGTPWSESKKLILDPKVDGLFYWVHDSGCPHFGRFTKVQSPALIEHTWMSPNTLGVESKVSVRFRKKGKHTLMTLRHSGIPNTKKGRGHEWGWNYFLDAFYSAAGKVSIK
jgi:uncharacterized protein YndB with AHSA1/START domain